MQFFSQYDHFAMFRFLLLLLFFLISKEICFCISSYLFRHLEWIARLSHACASSFIHMVFCLLVWFAVNHLHSFGQYSIHITIYSNWRTKALPQTLYIIIQERKSFISLCNILLIQQREMTHFILVPIFAFDIDISVLNRNHMGINVEKEFYIT